MWQLMMICGHAIGALLATQRREIAGSPSFESQGPSDFADGAGGRRGGRLRFRWVRDARSLLFVW